MKAIVLHAYGPPANLRYEDAPAPTPKAGEVLVRVRATSINPVDWMHRSGVIHAFMPIEFPHILGLDLAGTVEASGGGFSAGDRVMALAYHTYAELCVVRTDDLVRIPDGLSFTDAATLPLVVMTGEQLASRGAKPSAGETVLVTGALGGVGRAAVFAAVESGARVIAGVRGKRLDEARTLPGISDVVALDDDGAMTALPTLDAVADSVGGAIVAKLLRKLRPGGRYGCFLARRAEIGGPDGIEVNSVNMNPDVATIKCYAEAMSTQRFSMPVTRVFPLAEAAEAQLLAESGAGGKVVLTP